ncbi:hypothetical protein FPV67DRAFT_1505329, partial [Lyophyllum atratum]
FAELWYVRDLLICFPRTKRASLSSALATPESFESQLDVDAFFAELGYVFFSSVTYFIYPYLILHSFPTMQTQSTSEIEPMPTFAPDFDPLAPANMTPPEFVAFCGYDPSEFKSLGASCLNSLVDGVEIWSRVFEEITEKMQQSTAVGDTLFTDMDMGGNALQPIVSH